MNDYIGIAGRMSSDERDDGGNVEGSLATGDGGHSRWEPANTGGSLRE